jgi:hypothetical protein
VAIKSQILQVLKIPNRLQSVAVSYLLAFMRESSKHSLHFASSVSGISSSQFSRLLSNHKDLALDCLNRASRRRISSLINRRRPLTPGVPWKVAIIIDATLHERSSLHIENSQRFNHGDGWVIGHQWTNIVLSIHNQVVPLKPIPFLSKKYCKKKGLKYLTEPERILEYWSAWDWEAILPGVDPSEIVVLTDSGYDNKRLQTFVLSQGWSFVGSLKKSRGVVTRTQACQSVEDLFKVTRKIGHWKTIRVNGRKPRKEFRTRTLVGGLNGVEAEVRFVCSEKPSGGKLFLACSKENLSAGAIARTYRLRWQVEIFHRDVKSYLGLQDAGVQTFESLHSHVLWVYCAYLLLFEIANDATSLLQCQRQVQSRLQADELGRLLKLNARFDGRHVIRTHCLQEKERLLAS